MLKNLIKYTFLITSIIIVFFACDDGINQNIFNYTFPEDEKISYQIHVEPFLRLRCSMAPCHATNSLAGGIDLSSWFELQSGPGIINLQEIPGSEKFNPDASLLLQVMDLRNPHLINLNLIPPNDNQVQGIRRWLENGALNN